MWRSWGAFLTQEEGVQPKTPTLTLFKRIYVHAKPYRIWVALSLLAYALQAGLGLIPPLISRALIDTVLPQGQKNMLTLLGIAMLIIPLVSSALSIAETYCSTRISNGFTFDLRMALYTHLQRMSLRFFTNTKLGEVMSRLNNDVGGAQRAITGTFVDIITNSLKLIFAISIMFSLEWKLTIISLVLFPLFYFPARKLGQKVRILSRLGMDLYAKMNSIINETLELQGVMLMKIFGRERENREKYLKAVADVRDNNMQDSIISTLFYTMVGVIASVGSALVYWFGGMMAISGTISIGTIVAYVAYLGMIYGPLSALVNARIAFIKAMVSFERVFEVLDLPIEIAESENPIEPVEIRGDVRFENVSFTYSVLPGQVVVKLEEQKRYAQQWSTGDWRSGMGKTYEELKDGEIRWVLRDVSVEIKAGQMVALVGRSGAGKTTMTYLVPRLYDVNEGRVTIDGIDVRDLKLSWLQRHIGMVTQDVYLFHDTVRANLLYARPLASDDDIERACRVANIWDFIQSLPEGLDTLVGERGFKLSGGEKQRIAIARAVLKDPKILILDEATSNLDSESEILIQQALEHLFKGRTSIVIAHRLSTILKADVIVVLDKGQVVEIGTHHELLAKNGLYSMLYHTQFKQNKQVPSSKDNKNQYDSEIHKSVNIL